MVLSGAPPSIVVVALLQNCSAGAVAKFYFSPRSSHFCRRRADFVILPLFSLLASSASSLLQCTPRAVHCNFILALSLSALSGVVVLLALLFSSRCALLCFFRCSEIVVLFAVAKFLCSRRSLEFNPGGVFFCSSATVLFILPLSLWSLSPVHCAPRAVHCNFIFALSFCALSRVVFVVPLLFALFLSCRCPLRCSGCALPSVLLVALVVALYCALALSLALSLHFLRRRDGELASWKRGIRGDCTSRRCNSCTGTRFATLFLGQFHCFLTVGPQEVLKFGRFLLPSLRGLSNCTSRVSAD